MDAPRDDDAAPAEADVPERPAAPYDEPAMADGSPLGELAACAASMLGAIEATVAERSAVWTDLAFDAHATTLFRAQYAAVDVYRAWCDHELGRRGSSVDDVRRWFDVPALPIEAFKRARVAAHPASGDSHVWSSSTTTGAVPSRHHLPDGSLYEASLLAGARMALVPPAGPRPLRAVQLVPSVEDAPDSSLSHMCDVVRLALCDEGVVCSASPDGAWAELRRAIADDVPVVVLATSFALVHLLDATADEDAIVLPPGSRLMDTGGYKGRSREVDRQELLDLVEARLGLSRTWCENEYGMSELSSQSWLGTIAGSLRLPLPVPRVAAAGSPRLHLVGDGDRHPSGNGPLEPRWQVPWFRTRVVDPVTLAEVADGESGLLVHHDLANVWSCAAIRTEDLGVRVGRSWAFVGRAPGAELRGCSLRLEDVLG